MKVVALERSKELEDLRNMTLKSKVLNSFSLQNELNLALAIRDNLSG